MYIKFRETRQLLRGNRRELVQFMVGSVHEELPDMLHFVHEGSAVEHVGEVHPTPAVSSEEETSTPKLNTRAKRS